MQRDELTRHYRETAFALTAKLLRYRSFKENTVFSPYSLQHALSILAENSTDNGLLRDLSPFLVGSEKFRATKTDAMLLLLKQGSSPEERKIHLREDRDDVFITSSLDEAKRKKEDFQKNLLEEVLDKEVVPDGLNIFTAALFHAEWECKFDRALTKPKNFYASPRHDRRAKKVPMMRTVDENARGVITDDYEAAALSLDAWKGDVYFIKPKRAPEKILPQLENILANCHRDTYLEIPKLSLDCSADLLPLLREFPCFADTENPSWTKPIRLDKLTDDPLWITSATQKTKLEMDESGTTAKAFTQICMAGCAPESVSPLRVRMNSPYFIVITDCADTADIPVFIAWISNPVR